MKIQINSTTFCDALSGVLGCVSTRSRLPILSNVLLETNSGELIVTANDLNVSVIVKTPVFAIDKSGSITLPAYRLASIMRVLTPGAAVNIEVEKTQARITCNDDAFRLHGLGADEFPETPKVEGKPFSIPCDKLKWALTVTSFCSSIEESRPALNGACFHAKGETLKIVATDGRRLSMAELAIESTSEVSSIIPNKCLELLLRLIPDTGNVEVMLGENCASFRFDQTQIITKLIEGNYPNYQQVIPSESKFRLTVDRVPFLAAVKKAALMTGKDSGAVKISLSRDQATMSSNTADVGEVTIKTAVKYTGDQMEIGFNGEFLLEVLDLIPEPEIHIDLTEFCSPSVIKTNSPFLHVLMPIRVQ